MMPEPRRLVRLVRNRTSLSNLSQSTRFHSTKMRTSNTFVVPEC